MPPITTHILDTTLGKPAAGVALTLFKLDNNQRHSVAQATTNSDGRVPNWLDEIKLESGTYCLSFDTAAYFHSQNRPVFYPWVEIVFIFEEGAGHYHVPLLLSPYGYSTYRGS